MMSDTPPVNAESGPWLTRQIRSYYAKKPKEVEMKNVPREFFETVVFVLVLVLMLQRFVAEAFVIPTGSMAETLYGDHVNVTCRECGHHSTLNSSSDDGGRRPNINSYTCSNCGYNFVAQVDNRGVFVSEADGADFSSVWSGDRVLVLKPAYHINPPKRFDVPVFKWPVEPFSVKDRGPTNYIKRLVGLPGETIAIFDGNLFVNKSMTYPHRQPMEDPNDRWRYENMYVSDTEALDAFKEGKFEIIRKSPDEILAQKIIVFDMDKLPTSQKGIAKTRWHPQPGLENGWEPLEHGFKHTGPEAGWIRYHHLRKDWTDTPNLEPVEIRDYLGYNKQRNSPASELVTDLIVECTADFQSTDAKLALELNKGEYRYQAVFEKGICSLFCIPGNEKIEDQKPIASQPTKITTAGKHELRFANVDCRMTVWVDGNVIPFDEAADYKPMLNHAIAQENDRVQPARIGVQGNIACDRIRLWRDVYYLTNCTVYRPDRGNSQEKYFPSDVPPCGSYVQTFHVQPGHYLCFGDNSNSSLDGRMWGLVPERLLLGKAVMVYWPPSRFGVIK